jgi:hypothetical protein
MADQPLFAFSHDAVLAALEDWKAKQISAYPHQRERIEITVLAMQDFLSDDEIMRKHKLLTGTSPIIARTTDPAWDDPLGRSKSSP